jgi:hypothetical protein
MEHVHLSSRWHAEPRCTGCGHRVMHEGARPAGTREFLRSPWTWPLVLFEITGRIEARIRGRLNRTGRLPL